MGKVKAAGWGCVGSEEGQGLTPGGLGCCARCLWLPVLYFTLFLERVASTGLPFSLHLCYSLY